MERTVPNGDFYHWEKVCDGGVPACRGSFMVGWKRRFVTRGPLLSPPLLTLLQAYDRACYFAVTRPANSARRKERRQQQKKRNGGGGWGWGPPGGSQDPMGPHPHPPLTPYPHMGTTPAQLLYFWEFLPLSRFTFLFFVDPSQIQHFLIS